jgi:hypothetical protein
MHREQKELQFMNNDNESYFFPTNRRNLLSILSCGVLGPKETYAKYRSDLLDLTGGYLPLFKGGISTDVVSMVTNNVEMNYPVLVEIKKDCIPNEYLKGQDRENGWFELCSYILCFEDTGTIHFMTDVQKEDFLAKSFDNVPMENYEYTVSPELFSIDRKFEEKWVAELPPRYDDLEKLKRKGSIADKVTASVALLAKNMQRSDDAILLRALIEFSTIPDEVVISPEYDALVELMNATIFDDRREEEMVKNENVILMQLLLEHLIHTDPSEGWNAIDVLDRIYQQYVQEVPTAHEGIDKWYIFCKKILKNEMDIDPKVFSDESDIVKRAIFLFLLRPEYDDIIRSESSNLRPGHVVRILAMFLSGFWVGYERLSNEFKVPSTYHSIFSNLRAHVINKEMGNTVSPITIDSDLDITCDVSDKEYLCKVKVRGKILAEEHIDVPRNVNDILQKMKDNAYTQTRYDVFDNRISYTFEYDDNARKQPIYIDVERYTIRISSPCVEFTKYRTYEKKFTTKKVLESMMKENSRMQGKAYFVYEEGVNISLERRVAISNIMNVDIIGVIEFVARTADEFEKRYFGHDKVQ